MPAHPIAAPRFHESAVDEKVSPVTFDQRDQKDLGAIKNSGQVLGMFPAAEITRFH
jgi:hypothetical protein